MHSTRANIDTSAFNIYLTVCADRISRRLGEKSGAKTTGRSPEGDTGPIPPQRGHRAGPSQEGETGPIPHQRGTPGRCCAGGGSDA